MVCPYVIFYGLALGQAMCNALAPGLGAAMASLALA